MSESYTYQPFKDRGDLVQSLASSARVAQIPRTRPVPLQTIQSSTFASPKRTQTSRAFSVLSSPLSPPIETSLDRFEKTCRSGGSAVVVPNSHYVATQGKVEEVHHHHHHHHHHYHESGQKKREKTPHRARRASEVIKEVSKQREHVHNVVAAQDNVPRKADLDTDDEESDDDSRLDEDEPLKDSNEPESESPVPMAPETRRKSLQVMLQQAVAAPIEDEMSGEPVSFGEKMNKVKTEDGSVKEVEKPVKKEGYLMKSPGKGRWGVLGRWRKRYFKLSGRILMYMTNESSVVPKGMIDLSKVQIEIDPENVGTTPTPNAMLIRDTSEDNPRTYRICAESYEEILEWYRAIVTNAVHFTETGDSSENAGQESASFMQTDFYPLYRKPVSYYDRLRIAPDASASDVKKAFRKLAMEFHPDRNPDADPKEFAAISQAYETLTEEESRLDYDRCEKVKDVLRRGFNAKLYIPTKMTFDKKTNRSYPAQLETKMVVLFCDGDLKHLFYQAHEEKQNGELSLRPRSATSFELRFVQRVTYGRNDIVMASAFGTENLELEKRLVLHGSKLPHDVYIELDTHNACKELVAGFRLIRSEKSNLFKQNLKAWKERGYD